MLSSENDYIYFCADAIKMQFAAFSNVTVHFEIEVHNCWSWKISKHWQYINISKSFKFYLKNMPKLASVKDYIYFWADALEFHFAAFSNVTVHFEFKHIIAGHGK